VDAGFGVLSAVSDHGSGTTEYSRCNPDMDREVFVLLNGDSFSVWNVQFEARKEHRDTIPCIHNVESAKVSFCAAPGTVHVGQWGQLSSGDLFYDVKVSFVELAEGHVIIRGDAIREFGHEEKR